MFLILYVVFTKFLKIGAHVPHYPLYLLTGIMCWNFVSESTSQGLKSIVARGELLRKVNISKITIIFASQVSALINFLINLCIILVAGALLNVWPTWHFALVIPVLAELLLLCFGISLLLSAFNVRYRDVEHLWELLLQIAFYATPIIYPITTGPGSIKLPDYARNLLMLNPFAQIIQDIRGLYLPDSHPLTAWEVYGGLAGGLSVVAVLVIFFTGATIFKKRAKYFAEEL